IVRSCRVGSRALKMRSATRQIVASRLELPLLGSNQDSPDPVPLRLSPPLQNRSWSGLCLHLRLTRSGGSRPVSTPSPLGAWLGVASEGSADFESIHTRSFLRGVQRVHREVLPESGVLPITP